MAIVNIVFLKFSTYSNIDIAFKRTNFVILRSSALTTFTRRMCYVTQWWRRKHLSRCQIPRYTEPVCSAVLPRSTFAPVLLTRNTWLELQILLKLVCECLLVLSQQVDHLRLHYKYLQTLFKNTRKKYVTNLIDLFY